MRLFLTMEPAGLPAGLEQVLGAMNVHDLENPDDERLQELTNILVDGAELALDAQVGPQHQFGISSL